MHHTDGKAAAYWLEVSMENAYEEEPDAVIRPPGAVLEPPDEPFRSMYYNFKPPVDVDDDGVVEDSDCEM
ncbi:hypothetical protein CVT26_010563 [Gymnopilus dilepis]|uniref:Uncharacterized protein n=1 Tax=Gymnopilus dilepis TaxID=231916 RepID=A0A409WZD9_9AGAR|nr:hypothetical protein CVT26_010563 [Gymnopilus dilepis]